MCKYVMSLSHSLTLERKIPMITEVWIPYVISEMGLSFLEPGEYQVLCNIVQCWDKLGLGKQYSKGCTM
jgi:hypothetical protein